MKIEELRIGNYVLGQNSEFAVKVLGLKPDSGIYISEKYDEVITSMNDLTDAQKAKGLVFIPGTRCGDDIKNLNPVPLTEEWFVRLGFTDNYRYGPPTHIITKIVMELPVNDFSIRYDFQGPSPDKNYYQGHEKILLVGNGGYDESGEMELNIKYVHQLQNLIFALTGEELAITT